MYSQNTETKKISLLQAVLATLLIVTTLFMFTPRRADGITLLIYLATATTITIGGVFTYILVDGVILCATGVICSSGSKGNAINPATGCTYLSGNSCVSSANMCNQTNVGTVQCNGVCSAPTKSDFVGACSGTVANYCGQTGTGKLRCDGLCTSISPPPPNSNCNNLPLPADALVFTPKVVKLGDTESISWNLGNNWPPTCTLTGNGLSGFAFGPGDRTGTTTVTANGPSLYTLTCGNQKVTKIISILPKINES